MEEHQGKQRKPLAVALESAERYLQEHGEAEMAQAVNLAAELAHRKRQTQRQGEFTVRATPGWMLQVLADGEGEQEFFLADEEEHDG